MENIQKRALRFFYNDYLSNYETLLKNSQFPTLRMRRLRTIAIETFKIINKQCPAYLYDLIKIKNNSYSFRYKNTTDIPQVRTTSYGLNSFRFGAAKLWNSLPEHVRNESSYNQFRILVNSWNGENCKCSCCMDCT
jgi:hypothetical protein